MSLSTRRQIKMDNIDRISDLPSNVIDGILEHLDIRDQVRTSILSTKWRYIWTSVPQLKFDRDFFGSFRYLDDPGPVVAKVIADVLRLHNGPIYKFTLSIANVQITMEHVNTWFQILSGRDIKYIIFSRFSLSIPPNFSGFKRLLNLDLECVTFESGALESLISGCPLLEKLSIDWCNGFEYFDFTAPSLKVLYLDIGKDTKSICLKKAKNLIDLTLVTSGGWEPGLIKSLPKIQQLSLELRDNTKFLRFADAIPPTLLKSSFGSLEYLKLDGVHLNERGELLYIVSVLKTAPSLVELFIKSYDYDYDDITRAPNHLEEPEFSSCCLNRLQTVNIFAAQSSSQHAMSLMRFILANSPSLKTLTLSWSWD